MNIPNIVIGRRGRRIVVIHLVSYRADRTESIGRMGG